jgi:hypothetical protein
LLKKNHHLTELITLPQSRFLGVMKTNGENENE